MDTKAKRGRPSLGPRTRFVLRLEPGLYEDLTQYADEKETSLNAVIAEVLADWWKRESTRSRRRR